MRKEKGGRVRTPLVHTVKIFIFTNILSLGHRAKDRGTLPAIRNHRFPEGHLPA